MLNIIAGVEEVDEGQIIMQNGIRLAYLSQNPCFWNMQRFCLMRWME